MAGLIFLWQQPTAPEPTPDPAPSPVSGGGIPGAIVVPLARRRRFLSGGHQGANWSTGSLSAVAYPQGAAVGRSVSAAARPLVTADAAGIATQSHVGASPSLRAITPPTLETQRNALALLLLLNQRKP